MILITAQRDSDTKPNYILSTPGADSVIVTSGELATAFGENASAAVEAYNAAIKCLQAHRERDYPEPDAGNFNVISYDLVGHLLTVTMNTATIPTFTENDVVVIQAAGFTKSADSNTGHVRRMAEVYLEATKRALPPLLPGELEFYAFDDVDGAFVADVIIGTGNVTEGRTQPYLLPDRDTDEFKLAAPGAPAKYPLATNDDLAILIATARANDCFWSNDLTNAAWVQNGGTDIVRTLIPGLDGTADLATRLDDNNASVTRSLSYINEVTPTPGDLVTTRAFFKFHDPGEAPPSNGDYITSIQPRYGTPTFLPSYQIDPYARTVEISNEGSLHSYGSIVHGNWVEVCMTQAYESGSNNETRILPASPPLAGFRTGFCRVAHVEIINGMTTEQVLGSPPCVPTTGTQIVSEGTAISFDIANHDNAAGYYLAEMFFFIGDEFDVLQKTVIIAVGATAADELMTRTHQSANTAIFESEDAAGVVGVFDLTPVPGYRTCLVGYSAAENLHGISISPGSNPIGDYTGFGGLGPITIGPPVSDGRPFLIRNIRRYKA